MDIKAETQRMLAQHSRDRIKLREIKAILMWEQPAHRVPRKTAIKRASLRLDIAKIEEQMEKREGLLAALIAQEEG